MYIFCRSKEQESNTNNNMIIPSAEQQAVVDAVKAGKNVIVDAVAGSGKTTTVLSIGSQCSDKRILQITFNSQLKSEVREKVAEMGLDNITVHTYHSVATTFYDRNAYTDTKIISILQTDKPPKPIIIKVKKVKVTTKKTKKGTGTEVPTEPVPVAPTTPFDIIIIDEAQDMTLLYFKLVNKFIKDVIGAGSVQIVVLGDRYQGVYEFMKADTRFLTLADQVWGREFVNLTLRESYRVTRQIAWFVNKVMVGEDRIIAKKEGCKVEWCSCGPFSFGYFAGGLLRDLKNGVVRPEDIFVLTTSLKSAASPAKVMENMFVSHGIPVYVPVADEARMDEDVTRGKIVFATLPSSKGRERPIVVLLGFDSNYFTYYAKTAPRDVCPPTLYVAVTRATKKLIVVGNNESTPPPFTNVRHPDMKSNVTMKVEGALFMKHVAYDDDDDNDAYADTRNNDDVKRKTSPTHIVQFLKQETIEFLTPLVTAMFQTVKEPGTPSAIPCKVRAKDKTMYEDVSDLNGLAIPSIWEAKMNKEGATSISAGLSLMLNGSGGVKKKTRPTTNVLKLAMQKISLPCKSYSDFLFMCNIYKAYVDGYHGRLAQIEKYDWLTTEVVESCHKILEDNVSKNDIRFEYPIEDNHQTQYGRVDVSGFIDAITDDTIWEFKCVDTLQLEHMLQLIVYCWLYKKSNQDMEADAKMYKLLNIKTGEVRELIEHSDHQLTVIMAALFAHKYATEARKTDSVFVEECAEFRTCQNTLNTVCKPITFSGTAP
jgi:hypothetical protein